MSAEKNVILVTGGTGLVGQGIKYIVEIEEKNENDSYIFLSSKDVDLTLVIYRWNSHLNIYIYMKYCMPCFLGIAKRP